MTEGPGQVQTGVPGGAAGEDAVTERTAAPSAEPGQRLPRVLTPQQGRDQVCTPPVTAPYDNAFPQRQHGADALAAWAPGHRACAPRTTDVYCFLFWSLGSPRSRLQQGLLPGEALPPSQEDREHQSSGVEDAHPVGLGAGSTSSFNLNYFLSPHSLAGVGASTQESGRHESVHSKSFPF